MSKYINKVIQLFSKKKASDSSASEFYDWLIEDRNRTEKDDALFQLWNEPNDIVREDSYKAFATFLTKQLEKKETKVRIPFWRYVAAIALVVLCSTTVYSLFFNTYYHTESSFVEHYSTIGEVNTITLPDGSVVETNSASILVYPEDFGKHNRTLYLTGEANFKVVKDAKKPFIVKSKDFSVTALGTEFNVSSYPNDNLYKATLISGSIKVGVETKDNTKEEHILSVNEQFAFNRESMKQIIQPVDIEDATAWQRGELSFRGFTIEEIVKVLERKHNVVFHYDKEKQSKDKYNFRFKKDTSLENVLNVIKSVSETFDYKLVDDLCYIY